MQLGHFSGAPTLKMGNTWDQGLIYCLQACNLFITRLQAAARRSLANIFTPSKYFYVTLLLLTCEDPVHVRAPLGGLLLPPVLVGGCPGGGGGDLEAVLYQALITSSCAEVAGNHLTLTSLVTRASCRRASLACTATSTPPPRSK